MFNVIIILRISLAPLQSSSLEATFIIGGLQLNGHLQLYSGPKLIKDLFACNALNDLPLQFSLHSYHWPLFLGSCA